MKLIIFDLDGTLLDSAPDLFTVTNTLLADKGCQPISCDECKRMIGSGIQELIRQSFASNNIALTDSELDTMQQQFTTLYAKEMTTLSKPYEGCHQLLQQLKEQGYQLALCTNKIMRLTIPLLAHFQLQESFAIILGGDSLPTKKPDPAPLLHCCKQLAIPAEKTYMIGDSISDVNAARAAGIRSVLVTHGYRKESVSELQPDFVADNLKQVQSIITSKQSSTV